MIRTAVLVGGLLAGGPADADGFCADLDVLATSGTDAGLQLPNSPQQDATCQTSLAISGARQVHCYWGFAYRSAAALRAFETLLSAVAACLGPDASASRDQSVNHPDAYDLRLFRLEGAEFAVSLKDKGALQQTLVFLRLPAR